MSSVTMEATTMLPILKKKLAFLSGKTRVPTRGSSLWQLSNLHLHAVSSVIRFRSSTLSVCLQGAKTGAVVWSWPSLSVQIRPVWRSSAPLWTIFSASPGTNTRSHYMSVHSDVNQVCLASSLMLLDIFGQLVTDELLDLQFAYWKESSMFSCSVKGLKGDSPLFWLKLLPNLAWICDKRDHRRNMTPHICCVLVKSF